LPAEDEEGGGEGLLSPEGYAKHCDNVEDSSVWGSHTEVGFLRRPSEYELLLTGQTWQILALSKYYQVPIYVIQADSPVVKVGESEKNQKGPLTISYHRRAFGLGEHCEVVVALYVFSD
jgi:OTU domain-containing protein 6